MNNSYAKGFSFYKLFGIFVIGCFLGVIIETIWCFLRHRRIESRKGLVYGPFNLVYGFGALIMTLGLLWLYQARDLFIFAFGSFLGGVYEYICSWLQEKVVGTISWDYQKFPLNLNGRINLLYCFFWGILGLLWVRDLYPHMARLIESIPAAVGIPLAWFGLVFFIFDSAISGLVVYRMNERQKGTAVITPFWTWIDRHYPDEKVRKIYPNMKFNVGASKNDTEDPEKQESSCGEDSPQPEAEA